MPGLAEKRPSVILNDKIRVRASGSQGRWNLGYVHKVAQAFVSLRFHNSFAPIRGQSFDVRFVLGRSPLRRMHQALSVAWNPERIQFPTQEHVTCLTAPTTLELASVRFFNRKLERNPPQRLAVASVLMQPPGSVPFVIFGP